MKNKIREKYTPPFIKFYLVQLENNIVAGSARIVTSDTTSPALEEWDNEGTIPSDINW